MGFRREDVYIANVLKCRPNMPPGAPPETESRHAEEMSTCLPWLERQIDLIKPRVMVAWVRRPWKACSAPSSRQQGPRTLAGFSREFPSWPLTILPICSGTNRSRKSARSGRTCSKCSSGLERPISEKQRKVFHENRVMKRVKIIHKTDISQNARHCSPLGAARGMSSTRWRLVVHVVDGVNLAQRIWCECLWQFGTKTMRLLLQRPSQGFEWSIMGRFRRIADSFSLRIT